MGLRHGWETPHLTVVDATAAEETDPLSVEAIAHDWEAESLAHVRRQRLRVLFTIADERPLSAA
jgi:hypothetical protein